MMSTITSIPTWIASSQTDASCGKDCLGSCCMPGAKLPLYSFPRRNAIKPKRVRSFGDLRAVPDLYENTAAGDGASDEEQEKSFLDALLLAQWEDRMHRGLFRYDVTACQTKALEGEYGFVAQLNEGRHSKKRPTEFRVDQVLQAFDGAKFNFTKVSQEEALFRFEENELSVSHFAEAAEVVHSPNLVVINVSPIEYGHVLLVPRLLDCLPQRIQADTLLLALHMAVEVDNPYLRIGYNSLGAFATINHLHYQAYYLNAPFPIERVPTVCVQQKRRKRGLKISCLCNYPVRALVYELGNSLEEMAVAVAGAAQELERRNVPFNILIADSGARLFLMPQCFGERQARNEVAKELLELQVNPAVWEISGHIVLKRKEDYEAASESSAWNLLAQVSLSEEKFEEVKQLCLEEGEKAIRAFRPACATLPSVSRAQGKGRRCGMANNRMEDSQVVPQL